ncbi:MAG: hypothetical protein Q8Q40_09995 [Methylococcaceae bacterium]|nr:hypothetical protein [Methylococcaceae bacterium]MDP3904295.1 hypothetical protein [Methylococcaceae bacterium]
MKNQYVKTAVMSAFLLSAVGFSGASSAHTVTSTLGSASATNVDVHHTTCFSWTVGVPAGSGEVLGAAARFVGKVQKTDSATNIVKISLGKYDLSGIGNAQSTTTAVGASSSFASLANGNGNYVFAITHSSAASNAYTATFHCEKTTKAGVVAAVGFGDHTGTGVAPINLASPYTTGGDSITIINQ